MPGQNYFEVCDRDREGHCLPRGTREEREGEGAGMASDEASKQRMKEGKDDTEELEVEEPEFGPPQAQPTGPCIGVWVGKHRIGALFVATDGALHPEGNLASILMQPPEVLLEFLMQYSGVKLFFKPEPPPEMAQEGAPGQAGGADGVQGGEGEVGGDGPQDTTDGQSQEDSPTPAGEEEVESQGEEGGDEEQGPPRKKKTLPGYRRKSVDEPHKFDEAVESVSHQFFGGQKPWRRETTDKDSTMSAGYPDSGAVRHTIAWSHPEDHSMSEEDHEARRAMVADHFRDHGHEPTSVYGFPSTTWVSFARPKTEEELKKALPGYRQKSQGFHPDIVNLASAIHEGIPDKADRRVAFAELHDALLDNGHEEHARVLRNHGPQPVAHSILTGSRLGTVYSRGDRVRSGGNTGTVALTPEETGQPGFYHVQLDHRPKDEVAAIHHTSLRPYEGNKGLKASVKSRPIFHQGTISRDDRGQHHVTYPTESGGVVQEPISKEDLDYGDLAHHDAYTSAIHAGLGKEAATRVADHARHHATMAGHHHTQAALTGDDSRLDYVDFHNEEMDHAREEPWHAAGHASEKAYFHGDVKRPPDHPNHPELKEGVHAAAGEARKRQRIANEKAERLAQRRQQMQQAQQQQRMVRAPVSKGPQVPQETKSADQPRFRVGQRVIGRPTTRIVNEGDTNRFGGGGPIHGTVESVFLPSGDRGHYYRVCGDEEGIAPFGFHEDEMEIGYGERPKSLLPDFRTRRKLLPEMEKAMSSLTESGGGALREAPTEYMGPKKKQKSIHNDYHATGRALEAGDESAHNAHLDVMGDVFHEDNPIHAYAAQSPRHARDAYVAHSRPVDFRHGDPVVVRVGTVKNPLYREAVVTSEREGHSPVFPEGPQSIGGGVRVIYEGSGAVGLPALSQVQHRAAHHLGQLGGKSLPEIASIKGKVEDDDANWQEQTRQPGVRVRTPYGPGTITEADRDTRYVHHDHETFAAGHLASTLLPHIEDVEEKTIDRPVLTEAVGRGWRAAEQSHEQGRSNDAEFDGIDAADAHINEAIPLDDNLSDEGAMHRNLRTYARAAHHIRARERGRQHFMGTTGSDMMGSGDGKAVARGPVTESANEGNRAYSGKRDEDRRSATNRAMVHLDMNMPVPEHYPIAEHYEDYLDSQAELHRIMTLGTTTPKQKSLDKEREQLLHAMSQGGKEGALATHVYADHLAEHAPDHPHHDDAQALREYVGHPDSEGAGDRARSAHAHLRGGFRHGDNVITGGGTPSHHGIYQEERPHPIWEDEPDRRHVVHVPEEQRCGNFIYTADELQHHATHHLAQRKKD